MYGKQTTHIIQIMLRNNMTMRQCMNESINYIQMTIIRREFQLLGSRQQKTSKCTFDSSTGAGGAFLGGATTGCLTTFVNEVINKIQEIYAVITNHLEHLIQQIYVLR